MLATPLETATLPPGIRSRFVRGVNGLDIHILEAGYAPAGRPLVLLLHGFPEIAYSWRKVMPALARPRKHYQWYYATRPANAQIMHCRQGVHNFLRAYYHHKSADWKGNKPHRLAGWTAEELAKMPTYYIMDLFDDMPAAVGKEMPSAAEIAANQWLTEAELAVYAGEWQRTGFQGGLNWYRSRTSGTFEGELQLFAGRTIDVPSIFIGGMSDWGIYQTPGAFERTQE